MAFDPATYREVVQLLLQPLYLRAEMAVLREEILKAALSGMQISN